MKILVTDIPLAPRPDLVVAPDLDAALDALQAHRREPVLVVAEPETFEHDARTVRNAVAAAEAALVVVGSYRTARVHVAAALCHLRPEDYGLAREAAARLARQVHTRLALTGVSRLSTPGPSLGQQISGWWPPTRFEVDVSAGTVTRTRGFSWGTDAHLRAIQTGSDPRGPLRIDHGSAGPELTLPAPARRPDYASPVWAEQSVAPRDLGESVAALLADLPAPDCPMCGRRRAPDLCLWCGSHGVTRPAEAAADPPTNESLTWTITDDDLRTMGETR